MPDRCCGRLPGPPQPATVCRRRRPHLELRAWRHGVLGVSLGGLVLVAAVLAAGLARTHHHELLGRPQPLRLRPLAGRLGLGVVQLSARLCCQGLVRLRLRPHARQLRPAQRARRRLQGRRGGERAGGGVGGSGQQTSPTATHLPSAATQQLRLCHVGAWWRLCAAGAAIFCTWRGPAQQRATQGGRPPHRTHPASECGRAAGGAARQRLLRGCDCTGLHCAGWLQLCGSNWRAVMLSERRLGAAEGWLEGPPPTRRRHMGETLGAPLIPAHRSAV